MAIALAAGPGASGANAAGAPVLGDVWASAVFASSARLVAELNPNGLTTAYHINYITEAAYQANIAASKDGFTGAAKAPPVADAIAVPGGPPTVAQVLFSLAPDTAYRWRVVASNGAGQQMSPTRLLRTQLPGGGPLLPDSRGWEMVSPVQKNGGQVEAPGTVAGGGVPQAASGGSAIAYLSRTSFGQGAQGAPPASAYIATRTSGGWVTDNVTQPTLSAAYDTLDQGTPYQLFSEDLARGLLLNGDHCRGEASGCAVDNPPLTGTDAPTGYQDYYLLDSASGGFEALLGAGDLAGLGIDPVHFDLSLAGASTDLRHAVLSTCAALTPGASEVPLGEGCDPAVQNLYEWSQGSGYSLINAPPAGPGAKLAAQAGAISDDGTRVYWIDSSGALRLLEGNQDKLVDAAGGFETATPSGAKALFTKAGHLYSYDAASQSSADLTPAGGVVGVLGASADGAYAYFQDGGGLKLFHAGTATTVAAGAEAAEEADYPPAVGAARVSADGKRLLFVSAQSLTGYDNTDQGTGEPDSEVFLYDAAMDSLACVSCNPTGQRPIGPSAIPGALANGTAEGSTRSYKPRVLSADGRRVFFDSGDAIAPTDTNSSATDVYQWEAPGVGSCTRAEGCVGLVSSGRSAGGASFIDASADGADAYFITDDSLVGSDSGGVDLYDARVGGGFGEAVPPIPCEGDACQFLPSPPTDPTLTTLLSGPGNPKVRFVNRKECKPGYNRRGGKCIKERKHKKHHRHDRGRGK